MRWVVMILLLVLARSDNAMDCDKCTRECPGIFDDSFCVRCRYYCPNRRSLRRRCIEHWYYTGCKQHG